MMQHSFKVYLFSESAGKACYLRAFKLRPNKSPFQPPPMRGRFTFLNQSFKCHRLLTEKL